MNINIKATNIELTDAIRDYAENKVGELSKLLQNVGESPLAEGQHDTIEVDIEVAKTTNHHQKGDVFRAEINMAVPGTKHVLRASSEQWDLYVAIDEVRSEMQRQIKRYKGKRDTETSKSRRSLKRILRLSKLARRKDE